LVSGGKGANSYLLQKLSVRQSGFQVPRTSVLTVKVFDELVLANPKVRREVRALDSLSGCSPGDPDLNARARRIQKAIVAVKLPADLKRRMSDEFKRLGSDVAVRSSATCEDTQEYSAAGQGYTALHQVRCRGVSASVKQVWASLFSPGFIRYREEIGFPHDQARMAVLLQAFINPRAAGVVHSFDQGTGRPGYWISAQPGIGEGVVQPTGNVDHWFVGLLCQEDDILERGITIKQSRTVLRPQGGTRKRHIRMREACLDDRMILRIARTARAVQQYYSRMNIAENVDVEYAVDEREQLFVVQARPKWLQKTANLHGDLVVKVTAVDLLQVPRRAKSVRLSPASLIAVEGAVTAKLRIDRGSGAGGCLPGRVVVAHHTNNEYNAKFGSFAAVITSDGDQTSHAAQHAYEKQIPCVVGARDAVEALAPYDGKVVTFDARSRTVYVGVVPIIEVERSQDVWLTDPKAIQSFIDEGTGHENSRPWRDSKRKRPDVFLEDFEGHYRLRSNTYGYFQLDYYYRAWDRLSEVLRRMFGKRTNRVLKTQARQIKAIEAGQCLVHRVKVNDPESIYHYLMSVNGFGTADLEKLFEERLNGFQRFAAFVHGLRGINRSNVKRVVEELINVFAWMHFGFWLDSIAESFACRQLRYIRNDG
ncbi:MAG: PEP/pyruvate-binding domain-containing protein, partial [Phycisphaerae bacterium]